MEAQLAYRSYDCQRETTSSFRHSESLSDLRSPRSKPKSYMAGFIDAEGQVVIEPIFEDTAPFHEGLASVQMNQRWGAIDSDGNFVIPCIHSTTALKA